MNIQNQTQFQVHIPFCGLGTASLGSSIAPQIVAEGIKHGYRHIDCASRYKNQSYVGEALSLVMKQEIVSRKDLFITSKLWCSEQEKADVLPACRKTLNDLQLDYLDILMMHWPIRSEKTSLGIAEAENVIPYTKNNVLETWREMEKLVDLGLCRFIGVSNFNISMLTELIDSARIKPAVNQIEVHPYLPQHKLVNFCLTNAIQVTAFTPLGNFGRRPLYRNNDQVELLEDETLKAIAKKHTISIAQVALSWNIQRGISVIPKTTKTYRLKENLAAASIKLDAEDIESINGIDIRCRYIDFPWCHKDGLSFWEIDS